MSLEKIVEEAMAGRPLEMKEAFAEEIQLRIQEALQARFVEMMEAKDEDDEDEDDEDDEDEDEDLDEDADTHHTVDIDHMGGADAVAKKHNITLKKNKGTDYSHDASGKKKDLQKYLAHHYDDHGEAKENHPEVFKESADSDMVGEMKKLHASACSKTEMYAKMKDKYGCDKAKFEGLYASNCSK